MGRAGARWIRRALPVLVAIATAWPRAATADPLHTHCSIVPWSGLTFGGLQAAVVPGSIPGLFSVDVPALPLNVTPPAGSATCPYETTDIQTISLTLTFTNGTGNQLVGSVLAFRGAASFRPAPDVRYIFTSGQATTLQFTAHTLGNAYHVKPGQMFDISVYGILAPQAPTGIVRADLTASGAHYYLTPEPATAALLTLGLGALGAAHRVRRRRGR
jgi:hypothetical protein